MTAGGHQESQLVHNLIGHILSLRFYLQLYCNIQISSFPQLHFSEAIKSDINKRSHSRDLEISHLIESVKLQVNAVAFDKSLQLHQ